MYFLGCQYECNCLPRKVCLHNEWPVSYWVSRFHLNSVRSLNSWLENYLSLTAFDIIWQYFVGIYIHSRVPAVFSFSGDAIIYHLIVLIRQFVRVVVVVNVVKHEYQISQIVDFCCVVCNETFKNDYHTVWILLRLTSSGFRVKITIFIHFELNGLLQHTFNAAIVSVPGEGSFGSQQQRRLCSAYIQQIYRFLI